MELEIGYLGGNKIAVNLKSGRQSIETVDFEFDKNLDTLLIDSIDKILKRNKIEISSLKSVKLKEKGTFGTFELQKVDKNSSLYKIVRSFQEALKNLK